MKNGIFLGIAGAGIAIVMLGLGFAAGSGVGENGGAAGARQASAEQTTGTGPAMSESERGDIELVVRDYLVDHPEILLDMQTALQEKQQEEQQVAQSEVIRDASDEIFHSEHDGIVGNPEGDKTIVEFFDYNCGYCARALDDMQAMVEADPDLRFVLKEFPIFGPDSQGAHLVSMAVHAVAPEKYDDFHAKLLGGEGKANQDAAMDIATAMGIDRAGIEKAMKDPQIQKTFEQTYDLANRLQINGTPSYIIGDEVVSGALGKETLTEKVEMASACKDGTC